MAKPLGPLETQLLAYAQMRRMQVVRLGDLAGPLRLSGSQELKLLSKLSRKGLIARVIRGLYLLPPRLPLGGTWSPDEASAIKALMNARLNGNGADKPGLYQISGPNAFNRYGFDEQVPVRVYLYNNRFSGDRRVGAVLLTLIKVADERLGSTEETATPDGLRLVYASRVRALVDAVYDWSRFDSLPRGYDWIRRELAARRIRAEDLVRETLRFGNQGTIRRMGVLLDQQGVPEPLLRRLEKALSRSSSLIPWIPTAPKRGQASSRWGVVVNAESRGQ